MILQPPTPLAFRTRTDDHAISPIRFLGDHLMPAFATAIAIAAATVAPVLPTTGSVGIAHPIVVQDETRSSLTRRQETGEVEIVFTGGSAMDYIDLVRRAGTTLDRAPNVVAKPALAEVPLPPMRLRFPSDQATQAALSVLDGLQFPLGARSVAEIRSDINEFGVMRVWAEFMTTTPDGRIVRGLRLPTPAELAPPALLEPRIVRILPLGDLEPDATIDLISAAIELAELGGRTEVMFHDASRTLVVRTTAPGHQLVEQAIISMRRPAPDANEVDTLKAAVAERDEKIRTLQAVLEKLERRLKEATAETR
jgi:hypothetical protein